MLNKAMATSLLLVVAFLVIHSIEARSAVFKRGRCTFVEHDESDLSCNREFISECSMDFECNNTAKCCRTACHQYRCVEPISEKKKLCQQLGDIAFLLDASGSIGKRNFWQSKAIVKKIIKAFPAEKGHRHASIVYGMKPSVQFNTIGLETKTSSKSKDVLKLVDKIDYERSPMTRTHAALELVQKDVFSKVTNSQRTKIVVLFTDGIHHAPEFGDDFAAIGRKLEKIKVKMVVVLTGEQFDVTSLLKLCSNDKLVFDQKFPEEIIESMGEEMEYPC